MESNYSAVERISDIYVPSSRTFPQPATRTEEPNWIQSIASVITFALVLLFALFPKMEKKGIEQSELKDPSISPQ